MASEINELKVLLAEIKGEIALSEERLSNKLGETEFLKELKKRDEKIYSSIRNVDKRVTGLYIKVLGCAGVAVVIAEAIMKAWS